MGRNRSDRPQLTNPKTRTDRPALGFWTGGLRTIRTEDSRLIVHKDSDGKVRATELFNFNSEPTGQNVENPAPEAVEALMYDLKTGWPSSLRAAPISETGVTKPHTTLSHTSNQNFDGSRMAMFLVNCF